MLNQTLNLYRVEVTLNGTTSNIYFEDYEQFKNYADMMCKLHSEDDFEICSYGYYDMKVVGC